MASELQFVSYKEFVENLPARTVAKSGDKTVVSNSTDGPGSETNAFQAQNALAGNVAPAFDSSRTSDNPYKAGERVCYNGEIYTFKTNHYGAWSSSDVIQNSEDYAYLNKADSGTHESFVGTLTASNNQIIKRVYRKGTTIKMSLTISGATNLLFNGSAKESFVSAGTYEREYVLDSDVNTIGFYVYSYSSPLSVDLDITDSLFLLPKKVDKLESEITSNYFVERNNVENYNVSFSDGAYISASGGNVSDAVNGHYTDFIRVSEGDKFYITSTLNTAGAKVACYDLWKRYKASDSLITTGSYSGVFVVPSGISYIRISSYGSSPYGAYNIPKYDLSAVQKNRNLNVLVFGDSITEDFTFTINASGETTAVTPVTGTHKWSYYSNQILGFKELRNYAVSGATYKDQNFGTWNRKSIAEQVLIAINDKDNPQNIWSENPFNPDVIIFAAGTNDGNPNDTPTSALSKIVYDVDGSVNTSSTLSALDRSKFCEAVMWSMLKIRIAFPYALGLCLLPIQRCSSDINYGNLNVYLNDMARRYGFIPIDGISECGIIKDNNKNLAAGDTLQDGLHPNSYGVKMMTRMMVQAIDRYFYPVFNI